MFEEYHRNRGQDHRRPVIRRPDGDRRLSQSVWISLCVLYLQGNKGEKQFIRMIRGVRLLPLGEEEEFISHFDSKLLKALSWRIL